MKEIFGTGNYVKINLSKGSRVIAQLRFGSLPLMDGTGSYTNIPRDNRLCTQCNLHAVESNLNCIFFSNVIDTQ